MKFLRNDRQKDKADRSEYEFNLIHLLVFLLWGRCRFFSSPVVSAHLSVGLRGTSEERNLEIAFFQRAVKVFAGKERRAIFQNRICVPTANDP